MKYKIILIIILLLIFSCNDKNENVKTNFESGLALSNIFTKKDSIILTYPKYDDFPKHIFDISIFNNSIYVLGLSNSKPLIKFDVSGKFQKYIAGAGNGPGELNGMPNRIAVNNNLLVVLNSTRNKISIFKEDHFQNNVYLFRTEDNDVLRISDVEIVDDKILLFCYGISKNHMVLIDQKGKVINTYIKLQPQALVASLIGGFFWAVQRDHNGFISHVRYPFYVYKFNYVDKNIEDIKEYEINNIPNFQTINSDITMDKIRRNSDINKLKLYESFSKIKWIIGYKKYFICLYTNKGSDKTGYYICIFDNTGKIILDNKLANQKVGNYLLPYNNSLYLQDFSDQDNPKIKLYQLELREDIFDK